MARNRRTPPSESPGARLLAFLAYAAAIALVLVVPLVFDADALDTFRGPKRELALAAWSVLAAVFAARNLGGSAWRDRWWLVWGGVLAGGAISAVACPAPRQALANPTPAPRRRPG